MANDYEEIGLNEFSMPVDAPISKDRGFVSGYEFDSKYKVPLGGVNYTNFTKDSRPYTAVVSLSGEQGTFRDLQLAINYVNRLGGGIVFIKNGTYIISKNITLYSNIYILGETPGGVILDFNNAAFQIQVYGADTYVTGTISVSNGATAVTGVNTNWTSAMIGRSMLIGGGWYVIASVLTTTSITLSSAVYNDYTVSGDTYAIATPISNMGVDTVTLQNSTASTGALDVQFSSGGFFDKISVFTSTVGITFKYCSGPVIENYFISGCGSGLEINDVGLITNNNSTIAGCTSGYGMSITKINNSQISNFSIISAATNGMTFANSYNSGVINFMVLNSGSIGIELGTTVDLGILTGLIANNASDGLKLTAGDSRNTMGGLIIRNNTSYGVNIGATSGTNTLVNNIVLSNGTAFNNLGTNNLIKANIGQFDNDRDLGLGTIASGVAVGTVTYNLPSTPTFVNVTLGTTLGSASQYYVSSIGAPTAGVGSIVVAVNTAPGTAIPFYWEAGLKIT